MTLLLLSASGRASGPEAPKGGEGFSKCDLELMNSFKLVGMPFSSQDTLAVCAAIQTNCCTIVDEVAIVKFWREFSQPRIAMFAGYLGALYNSVFQFQRFVSMVGFEGVLTHFTRRKFVPYKARVCALTEAVHETHVFNVNRTFTAFSREVKTEQRTAKLGQQLKLYANMQRTPRLLRSLTPARKQALRNAGWLKARLKKSVRRAFRRFRAFVGEHSKEVRGLARKLANEYSRNMARKYTRNLAKFLKDASKDSARLEQAGAEEARQFSQQARMYIRDIPTELAGRAKEFKAFLGRARRHLNLAGDLKRQIIAVRNKINLAKKNLMSKALAKLINKKYPSMATLRLPDIRRELPEFDPIKRGQVVCTSKSSKLFRNIVLVNSVKYRYCFNVYQNIKMIADMDLEYLASGIKEQASKILSLKKTLYCAVCDASAHRFFDSEKNVVMISEDFCKDLMHSFMDYINFNNVIFIEYADQLLQYLTCLNSLPTERGFPLRNRLDYHKRNIVFFRRCFDNLEADDMMRYCHFICSTFNFDGFSKLIDGDLSNLYLLYLEILDFARNNGIPFTTKITINRTFLESLDHSFYAKPGSRLQAAPPRAKAPKLKPRILAKTQMPRKKLQKAKKPKKSKKGKFDYIDSLAEDDEPQYIRRMRKEVDPENYTPPNNITASTPLIRFAAKKSKARVFPAYGTTPIYERVEKVVSVQTLRPLFFEGEQGMNPLQILPSTYFELDIESYLRKHFAESSGNDPIKRETIKAFFSLKPNDIHEFNSDIYIAPTQSLNVTDAIWKLDNNYTAGFLQNSYNTTQEPPAEKPREAPEAQIMF